MAAANHPDRNPGDKAAEDTFIKAASAYEILGDAKKKAEYDRYGANSGGGTKKNMIDVTDHPFENTPP